MKVRTGACVAAVVASIIASVTMAQNYPTRPIRYVVAFSPGGVNDILARIVGQKLADSWGRRVIVDNRAGARWWQCNSVRDRRADDSRYSAPSDAGTGHDGAWKTARP